MSMQPHGIVKIDPTFLLSVRGHHKVGGKIAPGFKPKKAVNLTFRGGKTLPNLSFKSVYLGGARWTASDMHNIDMALSGALADPHLNNVIKQYYPGVATITSTFLGSSVSTAPVAATFNRDAVNPMISSLIADGTLGGVDFDTTVVCLFLPQGAILTTDAAGGVGKVGDGDKSAASSTQGLGGYHGSCHIGAQRVYFSVGVYSEVANGVANGIPVWPDSWKNIVATFYHELVEARTDPDVEDAIRANNNALLGWYSDAEGEIGDIPITEAGANLHSVFVEVALVNGTTAPIQLMWSNAVGGPQGPFA